MRHARVILALRAASAVALLAFVFGACTEPIVPTTVTLNLTSVSLTALGATQQLTATVADQNGRTIADAVVTWTTNNSAVASVSATGVVTGVGVGAAQVTATAGAATASASVTVTQVPAQLEKVSGDAQLGTVGQALADALVVQVNDSRGNPAAGIAVTFANTQEGGSLGTPAAMTGTDGRASSTWTLGPTPGTAHQVTATVTGGTAGSTTFTATANAGPPASITKACGDNQQGATGAALANPIVVRVEDQFGNDLAGVTVTFAVTGGDGSVDPTTGTTGSTGEVRTVWTLGPSPGTNTATATVASVTPATFTATGVTGSATGVFNIALRNVTCVTMAQQTAFDDAAAKWQTLVIGDLKDILLDVGAGMCGSNSPAINETVDDVLLLVTLEPIDGAGGVLGSAGPCFIRTSGSLPVLGRMRFDTDDLAALEASGQLGEVIVHEMGHVLGFGTLWTAFGFLQNPSLPSSPGVDTHFNGSRAIAAFDAVGGTSYTGGAKVPVENSQGGPGTRDAHWRESVFGAELMTGFINSGVTNPLSRVSTASLWDLGYQVNLDGSDTYNLPLALIASGSSVRRLHLKDDVAYGPVYVVDATGRVVRRIELRP